jgi:hypothetical protein
MTWLRKAAHPGAISLDHLAELTGDYFELARFWVSAEKGRSYVLVSHMDRWEPELLGSLLDECFHTAAVTFAARGEMTEEEALARLRKGFDDHRASDEMPAMRDTE